MEKNKLIIKGMTCEQCTVPVNTNFNFDLAIIGTGAAGMAAAIEAESLGKKIVIFEKSTIGGTCVNVGCIPSKAFLKAANLKYQSEHSVFKGLASAQMKESWNSLLSERIKLVEDLRKQKYENVLKGYPGIKLIQSEVKFKKNKKDYPVLVLPEGEIITAKKYVIATGSKTFFPDVKGINETGVLNSTDALFLKNKPKSMIVIGGGFIATELAQGFSNLGVKIISMEVRSRLLSKWDEDISEEIEKTFVQQGIAIHKGSTPVRFFKKGNLKAVEMKDKDGTLRTLFADEILMATGRTANTKKLNLKDVNVELSDSDQSILVNKFLQTSNSVIYAAGDVAQIPKLVYVAAKSGKIAVQHAFSEHKKKPAMQSNFKKVALPLDLSLLPEVVFSNPQIAKVGLSERELKDRGIDFIISKLTMDNVPKALVSNKTNGFIKLVANKKTRILLGAQIISENAGDLIQTVLLAMLLSKKTGFTIDEFTDLHFPYLTEVEGLKLSAQTFNVDVAKLSCCAG